MDYMKLNVKKTIFVGVAFLIISLFWQVYDNVIAKMLINSFGLNQFWSGAVMALDNVLALFLLPLFGAFSDKTKTRYGKRTPYIFWGVIVSAILFIGVAVVDSMQLKLLDEEKIPAIVTEEREVDGAKVNIYIFDYEGIENKEYASKEDAQIARSEIIYNITKTNSRYFVLFTIVLFIVLVSMATFRTPAVSLMPDVTPKPLRSKANAIINLMGAFGGVVALGIMTFFAKDYHSYITLFAIVSGLMLILLAVFMTKVKEPKLLNDLENELVKYDLDEEVHSSSEDKLSPEVKKSFLLIIASIVFWFMAYNAATTKFSIYAQTVLDMGFTLPLLVANIAAIICFIPIGIIASKVGRRKTILVGIAILFIAFILGILATKNTKILMYFTMSLAGIGWASINVNSYPMIVEMSKGANIGKYTGYYYSASMAAQIITPMLSGFFMDKLGMKVLFPYSVIFCVFAFTTMFFVKHGDSKPIPKSKIEVYDLD